MDINNFYIFSGKNVICRHQSNKYQNEGYYWILLDFINKLQDIKINQQLNILYILNTHSQNKMVNMLSSNLFNYILPKNLEE